jgi:hypothetical protein
MRSMLIQVGSAKYFLVFVINHMISDLAELDINFLQDHHCIAKEIRQETQSHLP